MRFPRTIVLALTVVAGGCAAKPLPPVAFPVPARRIDYLAEVKPLLDKRCVVCHSCYKSPCKLKLDSFEGADRGATKRAVYNASRLSSMDPTRLFTDAQTTQEWRGKQFFSVTESTAAAGANDSSMIRLLSHKMKNPKREGDFRAETDELTCAENGEELGGYLEKHPNRGMPYGFPPLEQVEFETIAGWLVQGARGARRLPAAGAGHAEPPRRGGAAAVGGVSQRGRQARADGALLYEPLFLAHIRFGTATNEYFERSVRNPHPGSPSTWSPPCAPTTPPG